MIGMLLMSQPFEPQLAYSQMDNTLTTLQSKAEAQGSVRVIIKLDTPSEANQSEGSQRQQIISTQDVVNQKMARSGMETLAAYETIPFMAVRVDQEALEELALLPEVIAIEEDVPVPTAVNSTIPVIGADVAWANGFTGDGQTVAILDTGVDLTHPAFTTGGNRIVAQGCYSTSDGSYGAQSVCPGGAEASTVNGSGDDCVTAVSGYTSAQANCTHGTHVAGIVAGNDGAIFGVAKDANLISIQIFSLFTTSTYCGGAGSCMLTFTSDQIAGLERVYALRNQYNIAAVNMSLGGSVGYDSPCDSDSRKAIIDNLREAGIATIIASGNNGFTDGISKPACISSAISVAASTDSDVVASFSNVSPILDLVAPGVSVYAAVPSSSYGTKSGTSMAAPHVAGAWALYKEAVPFASVGEVLASFQTTGTLIDDTRNGGLETNIPRIHVAQAINSYIPGLTVAVTTQQYQLPGNVLTYTLRISNDTAVQASNIQISAQLPTDILLDANNLSGDATVTSTPSGSQIVWTTGETLASGEALTRTFHGTVAPNSSEVTLQMTATASSPDMEEERSNTAVTIINQISPCNFSDNFESGALSPHWAVATTEDGRVTVSDSLPKSGSYSLVMDDMSAGGTFSEANAILNIDLANQASIMLQFDWFDLADEYDPEFDGLFLRPDIDAPWVKIFDFDSENHASYQTAVIDLLQAANNAGLTLSSSAQLRFGFYDNYPASFSNINGGDGYAIDNVSLSCAPVGLTLTDLSSNLSLDPGELITVTLAVVNNDAFVADNAIISSNIPPGLNLAGPVEIHGGSGDAAEDGSELPILVSGLNIPANGQVTVTLPLTADLGLAAGHFFEVPFDFKSDDHPQWRTTNIHLLVTNAPPVAQIDNFTTSFNTPLTLDPLSNDGDPNGDPLSLTAVTNPNKGGTAWIDGNTILYAPNHTFGGVEQFSYTVQDSGGETAVGHINVTVPNEPPVAQDDVTQGPPNQSIQYPVLHNDSDPNQDSLTVDTVDGSNDGVVEIVNNRVVFTPDTAFEGTVVLTYTISDGNGGSDAGSIEITIGGGLNGAPVAQADQIAINRNQSKLIAVLNNDIDPNSDSVAILAVAAPTFGTAVIQSDKIRYTPPHNFVGIDTLQYTIVDANGAEAETAVTITVGMQNSELISVNPNATTSQTVYSSDNRIRLTIPAGALPASTTHIAYTPHEVTQKGPGATSGIYFSLNIGKSGQIVTNSPTFTPPLEITVQYDPFTFANGTSEENVRLYTYDGGSATWQEVELAEKDLMNNTITAVLSHFTEYKLEADYITFLPTIQQSD